jgi:methyl-accepting chemotaxis protein
MILNFFNWLLKKVSFTQATILICLIPSLLSLIFGFFLVIFKADFAVTGTKKLFIITYFLSIFFIALFGFILTPKIRSFKILDRNIVKGEIKDGISNQELLELYRNFKTATQIAFYISWIYPAILTIICSLVEWLVSGQWINIPVMVASGIISALFIVVSVVNTSILVNYQFIKKCKNLLAKRGIKFEDFHLTNLKTRLWLFLLFMSSTIAGILILIYPFKLNVLISIFIGLLVSGISIYLIIESIYKSFSEIKEATQAIVRGEIEAFFSGSYDKEIIDLSKSVNAAAREIYNSRKELEEAKTVLEIKVQARTRELRELAQSLDEKVKQRTKELQERIRDLERFKKLTIGRELRMIELKRRIKELEKELKKKQK